MTLKTSLFHCHLGRKVFLLKEILKVKKLLNKVKNIIYSYLVKLIAIIIQLNLKNSFLQVFLESYNTITKPINFTFDSNDSKYKSCYEKCRTKL